MDEKEALFGMFKQYMQQGLHHQQQGSIIANVVLVLFGAIVALNDAPGRAIDHLIYQRNLHRDSRVVRAAFAPGFREIARNHRVVDPLGGVSVDESARVPCDVTSVRKISRTIP